MSLVSADTYARLLGLDPRHGFMLPSRAGGVIGRIDPDEPVRPADELDYPVRRYVWIAFMFANIGMLVIWTWPFFVAVGLCIAFMGLLALRADKRYMHLAKAYPVPYFDT